MPESSTAMPTPRPSSAPEVPAPGKASPAPLTICTRLAWRCVARFGAMASTSLRAASAASADAGSIADKARTDT